MVRNVQSSPLPYFIVDAFTSSPFAGNPAAVVPLDEWPESGWLQNVAMEMNLSETAFIVPSAKGFDLRWFTPSVEVDLCGHATLAAAKALTVMGLLSDGSEVAFSTRSGVLVASRQGEQFGLDFPLEPERESEPSENLLESLGARPLYVGKNRFDYLIELESETVVWNLNPDFQRMKAVPCRGVIATARSDSGDRDFVSRFFAPAVGVDEDPVTGSAHCCLADFWGRRLCKTQLVGYQASKRGGKVKVEVRGDRVVLGGEAALVARGELYI